MSQRTRVYLDHAATSWPKSEAVIAAMVDFIRDCGAAAGRGGYASAAQADQVVTTTRRIIAQMIGAESSESVSFHSNGTAALNVAIHGVLRQGDHVVTTAAEHNSVLRPLHFRKERGELDLTVVPVDQNGRVDAVELLAAVRPATRLVAMTHASNVTGAVQPVAKVAETLADHPALFLCDAAQTFGVLPINVHGIDLLAAPGHKASGGPLGTAFLYVSPAIQDQIVPSIHGGTGSQSESMEMPQQFPTKVEAGNLNVPALAGWSVALQNVLDEGLDHRQQRARELAEQLFELTDGIPGLHVYGRPSDLPIVSLGIEGLAPSDLAAILDAEYGIETRAGMHCAAALHACIGSEQEGTLRMSAGPETSKAEIEAAVAALRSITQAMMP